MPEWLTGVFQGLAKDGPAFAILLGCGWVLFRHLTNQQKEHLASLIAKQEGELARIVAVYDKLTASKESEIARLFSEKEAIQKDRDALYKQIKAEQENMIPSIEFVPGVVIAVFVSLVFYFLVRRETNRSAALVAKMNEDFHRRVEEHVRRIQKQLDQH